MAEPKTLDTPSARKRKTISLSGRFVPHFFEDCDGRIATVKRIKKRLEALRRDAHVDNVQREMLAQRAVFLALQLESMERRAAEGEAIEAGVYSQGCNALLGLLRALGLVTKHRAKRQSLKEYVDEKDAEE